MMVPHRWRFPLVTFILILSFLLLLTCHPTGGSGIIQPPAGLNKVYLKMHLLACSEINGVSQTFTMEFFLLKVWAAPAGSTGLSCSSLSTCSSVTAAEMDTLFWQPNLQFINSRDSILSLTDEPFQLIPGPPFGFITDPLPAGWLWIQENGRYQVTFGTDLNMNAFPFDIQHLKMHMESGWRSDQVALVYANPATVDDISAEIAPNVGWTYIDSGIEESNQTYAYNGGQFSRFTYISTWEREPQYYLTKIVAGTMLLVWMSIWNFSLQVDISDRMMGTLQIYTGLIAFLFVAGGDTPKLPYQTRLDIFMTFSFVLVGFVMFIHGVLYYFREQGFEGDKKDKLEAAERKKRKEFLARRLKNKNRQPVVRVKPASNNYMVSDPNATGPTPLVKTASSIELVPKPDTPKAADGVTAIAIAPDTPAAADTNGTVSAPLPGVPESSKPDADTPKLARVGTFQRSNTTRSQLYPETGRIGSTLSSPNASAQNLNTIPEDEEDHGWEVRLNDWSTFNFTAWFASLACTRKWDVIIVPTLFLFYTIGCAVILGRKPSDS